MTSDENAVRTLLRDSDIPPTRLEVAGLMAGSRRSRRRRRVAAAAGAVLAVVGVAVPAVVVANLGTGPERAAGDFATTTRVVHRTTQVGGPVRCSQTPLPASMAGPSSVYAVDATGERVVAANHSFAKLTLWTRGQPTVFTWPNLRTANPQVSAVNAGGTVVGYDAADPVISYLYRDGVVQTLAKPDGYGQAKVVDVNERGDALGLLSSPYATSDRRALVVWQAGRPDQPRVIAEAGLTPVAIRDDGTVVALRTGDRSPSERGDAVVVHRPDGTRLQIDAPPGFTVAGSLVGGVARGDLLFTMNATGQVSKIQKWSRDEVTVPVTWPVRWNLRTGLVEIFDDLVAPPGVTVGSSGGWFLATTYAQGVPTTVVAPDGSARELPQEARVDWLSVDGSTMVGTYGSEAVTWKCT